MGVLDPYDFLENVSKDLFNIGNLNKANDTLLNLGAPMFRKIMDMKLWSILDDPESEFWILKIFLKIALRILLILKIEIKQMIFFKMQVVPGSGKFSI